jgi:hypothetical protein
VFKIAERIAALVDVALEPDCFAARCRGLPGREAADGEAAFAPEPGAVVEDEGLGPAAGKRRSRNL